MKDQQNNETGAKKDISIDMVTVKEEPGVGILTADGSGFIPENFVSVNVKVEPQENEESRISPVASHIESVFKSLMSKMRVKLEAKITASNTIADTASASKSRNLSAVEEGHVPSVYSNWRLKPFVCEYCGERFHNETGLAQHAELHTVAKPNPCIVFQSLMSKMRVKLDAKNTTNNTTADTASMPKSRVPTVEEVRKQLEVHVPSVYGNWGLKPFKCDDCGERFYNETGLAQHAKVHTVEKPYPCTTCGKSFALRRNLVHHEATHKDLYSCPLCGKDMKRKMFLDFHVKLHLSKQHGHHPCETCGCVFNTLGNLRRHMRAHKPYRCELCGNRFFTQDELETHKKIHGEGLVKCKECQQKFCTVRQLIVHRVHHSNGNLYRCDACGRRFSKRGPFVVHLKKHTNEKPFLCSFCNVNFPNKRRLGNHVRNCNNETITSSIS